MSEKRNEEDRESGFKVTDKRHFTPDGEVMSGSAEEAPEEAPQAPPEPAEAAPPSEKEEPKAPEPPPEEGQEAPGAVDFTHLVISLAGTAYHALGIPDPVTKAKGVVNLPAASQMIDLLAILEEKTRGNLNEQEERIIQGVLIELRGLFVQTSGFKP